MGIMNMTLNDVLANEVGWVYVVFAYLYIIAVWCAMAYGVITGFSEWSLFVDQRKPIKLAQKFAWVQGIVNAAIVAGYAVWYVIACAGSTTFVAATFPISVPVITFFFSEPDTPKQDRCR